MQFQKIEYAALNARQQENYNFHKIAAVLAEYGYQSIKLSDDFQGADFLAIHVDGITILRVQLKGRLTFAQKYIGKNLHIGFRRGNNWYLYPHDEVLQQVAATSNLMNTSSWIKDGLYSFPNPSADLNTLLEDYKIG